MAGIDYKSLEEIKGINDRYKATIKAFDERRRVVGQEISDYIAAKGYGQINVAERIGTDPGAFSRVLRNEFAVSYDSLVKLSQLMMNKSCHEIMFGENTVSLLPRQLVVIVSRYVRESAGKKRALMDKALELYDRDIAAGTVVSLPAKQVIRQRIAEFAGDHYRRKITFMGDNVPTAVQLAIQKYDNIENYQGTLSTLMYYAYRAGTSIDYFITVDYTVYTPIGYLRDNELIEVTDPLLIEVVGKYLRMSEGNKLKFLSYVYEEMIG